MPLPVIDNLVMTNVHRFSRWAVQDREALRRFASRTTEQYQVKCSSLSQPVRELSGGNQQKVSLGKWAARDVKTLFLDEPSRGVDVGSRVEVYRLLRSFADRGGCCLFASSEAAEVATLADRAIVLKRGRIAAMFERSAITESALLEAAL